ncbi:phosphate ABC transporter permease PstA [Halobacteriovorax sp.]|uniref:phosphate ABC transporter permease PstA n=1 Tax=Halobacteriovorax sp. TaxID=2020862 RepID=UPI003AF2DA01
MEGLTKTISWFIGIALIALLFFILGDIILVSIKNFSLSFLLDSPFSGGRKGGILPIIVSTLLILIISLVVVILIGLNSSLYLAEFADQNNRSITIIRKSIEILSAVPSIVFGLFGNAIFSVYFGMGFSILSGGLTLAIMALPLFITTVEKGIRSVPNNYRHVAFSLGMSRFTMIKAIIIPYSLPAIFVGIVLSVGRALAETAALIFTSGYVDRMPESIFDSGRSLSIHIYDLTMNVPGGDLNAYKTSLVLIVLILTTNTFLNASLTRWYRKRIAL